MTPMPPLAIYTMLTTKMDGHGGGGIMRGTIGGGGYGGGMKVAESALSEWQRTRIQKKRARRKANIDNE